MLIKKKTTCDKNIRNKQNIISITNYLFRHVVAFFQLTNNYQLNYVTMFSTRYMLLSIFLSRMRLYQDLLRELCFNLPLSDYVAREI